MNQRERGLPSLMLHIHLMKNRVAAKHFDSLEEQPGELYSSLEEMFAANRSADKALRAKAALKGTVIVGVEKRKRRGTK